MDTSERPTPENRATPTGSPPVTTPAPPTSAPTPATGATNLAEPPTPAAPTSPTPDPTTLTAPPTASPAEAVPEHHLDTPTPPSGLPAATPPFPAYTPPPASPAEAAPEHHLDTPTPPSGFPAPFPAYTPPAGYAYPLPKPPGPPRSTPAAILLNLTGLGLGYGYLRRRVLLGLALTGTAGLVAIAFLTDAANNPWLWRTLTVVWLVILGLHAGLIARRHLPATSKKPALAGVAAIVLVAAGAVGYGIAGNLVHNAGVDAQKAGDCATALDRFDTVTGPFQLTLSANVPDAEARTVECTAYARALAAQKNGDHNAAIKQYTEFREKYPASTLRTFVHHNLAETYVNRATDWQLPVGTREAIAFADMLLMVLRDFDDTPAADRVPKAVTDLFEATSTAYQEGKFCEAREALDYFAALDAQIVNEVVIAANTNRARALVECGLSQIRGGNPGLAIEPLDTFLIAYPQDPAMPQARSALVTAKVAAESNITLPVPPPLGDNSPGDIPVTFFNDSNTPLTILVAGPTAHEITVPACAICPADYPPGVEPCPTVDGRPSVTVELTATTYYVLTERGTDVSGYTGSITPLVGYELSQCMYVERS